MNQQHILLTGASGGLGRALALEFSTSKVLLSLTGRNEERLKQTADQCSRAGARVSTNAIDIRQSGQLNDWIKERDDFQPVDLVIANAGVSSSIQPDGHGEHLDDVNRSFAINTLGVVETVTYLAERMRQRGKGQIAIIGSLAGLRGSPSSPSYSASKSAAMVYGDSLRAWLAPYGVRVSVVAMGYVDTDMSGRYIGDKPYMIPAQQAAQKIRRGLARNEALIVFPWRLGFGTRLLGFLPRKCGDAILRRYFSFVVDPDADSPLCGRQQS